MVLTTATHLVNNIAALDRKTTGCDRIGLHEASFKKPHSRAMGCRELVAINGSLENWPQLVRGVRPGVETLILDPNCDGVAQITAILRQAAANDRYTTLHLVSHGEPGSLKLGNGILSRETLSGYESDLQLWQKFLGQENSFGSEILIYGCSFAAQETSRNFVRVLGKLTGAKIAASRSLVGCAARGGHWNLDFRTGEIATDVAFGKELQQTYTGILATFTVNSTDDTVDVNPGDGIAEDDAGNIALRAYVRTLHESRIYTISNRLIFF